MPRVSWNELIRFLEKEPGYQVVRQRGSHVVIQKQVPSGKNTVSVPLHKVIAKGTLNDILAYVATPHGMSKEELLNRLAL